MSLKYLDLYSLVGKGYFPRELPPPFSTSLFARKVSDDWGGYYSLFNGNQRCITKSAIHSIPRVGALRRKISIPNPISFAKMAYKIVENKNEIDTVISSDTHSVTHPVARDSEERAIVPSSWFEDFPKIRARERAGARYVLKADISKFYDSIYTHSIPWATHGKKVAKMKRRPGDLYSNVLDQCLRDMQDGQTVGIPMGPDTSFVISELVLSKVDELICENVKMKWFRFIDDFEFSCISMGEVERVISALEGSLSHFELQLNPSKLHIVELPDEIDTQWAAEMRTIYISEDGPVAQYYSLLNYFNKISKYIKLYPDQSVAKYCVSRLASTSIKDENKRFVFDFLMQCCSSSPACLPEVIEMLYRNYGDTKKGVLSVLEVEIFSVTIFSLINRCLDVNHTNEIAWAIWACILFDIDIPVDLFRKIIATSDCIVLILALDAYQKRLVTCSVDLAVLDNLITDESYCDETWLFAYESCAQGWLNPLVNPINKNATFSRMNNDGVKFYDSITAPLDLMAEVPIDRSERPDTDARAWQYFRR